jgi:sugar diacid utilization regulator
MQATSGAGMTHAEQVVVERLEQRLARKERELHALAEITRTIGQTLPLRAILDRITAQVAELLNCPFCAILLWDPDDDRLTIEGAYGLDPQYIERVNTASLDPDDLTPIPSGEVLRAGRLMVWEDVRTDPDFAGLREATLRQGYVTMASIPLMSPVGMIGTLNCYYTSLYRLEEHEVALLTATASHAAIAIHNADLIDRLSITIAHLSDANQVIQEQHAGLTRSEEIHRRFTQLVLDEQGLARIVETLAALLDCSVTLYNYQGTLVTLARSPISDALPPVTLTPQALRAGKRTGDPAGPRLTRLAAGQHILHPALVAPIVARGVTLGYLVMPDAPALAAELSQRAIEHAITVCALELVKERNALEIERRLRGNFINDLLTDRFTTADEIHRRAAYLGYALATEYRVVVVDADDFRSYLARRQLDERQAVELKQQLTDSIDLVVRQAQPRAIVAPQGDRAVVLLPSRVDDIDITEIVADLATLLRASISKTCPELTVSLGISARVGSLTECRRGHGEALDALALAKRLGRSAAIVWFDDLGVFSLLMRSDHADDLLRFAHHRLDPLITQERRRAKDLVKTIELHLRHGCSPRRTADQLAVHANTVKHRLAQIQDLIGVDFDNTQQLLELELALMVRRMAGATFDQAVP